MGFFKGLKKRGAFFVTCCVVSISCFCFSELAQIEAFGYIDINSVTRLDISKGKISGQKVNYSLQIPEIWIRYMIAEREDVRTNEGVLEKITFSYYASDNVSKPVPLFSFYVYDKNYWNEKSALRKILRTEDNVFAVSATGYNPFTNSLDKAVFGKFLKDVSNEDYMRKLIVLPNGTKIIENNVVTVMGAAMTQKSILGDDGFVYIPVKDVCEALSYRVGWLEKQKLVSIARDDFYYLLMTPLSVKSQNFEAKIVNDRAYVSTKFVMQILKVNVEIDENLNVNITE